MTTELRPTLKGQAAIDLWLQGRRARNQWVDQHPETHIDFSEVDFSPYRDCDSVSEYLWPFAGFVFPNGGINFINAQFGKGNVSFMGATFKGPVFFIGTVLGGGQYNFEHTDFSDRVIFLGLENAGAVQGFSFKFASFNGPLQFSAQEPFNCVIDLIGTKITHHVSLAGLRCNMQTARSLSTEGFKWLNKTAAADKDDAERFRRL